MTPGPRWRGWAIQASWNRRSMQAAGWWVALEPWLDATGWDRPRREAVLRRHGSFANTNPYVAGMALGVLMRLEEDGEPELARTTVASLSRSLGALGDGFFWLGLRPLLALAGIVSGLLIAPVVVLGSWGIFLGVQTWARSWCGAIGYSRGREVVSVLRDARIHRATQTFRAATAALTGAVLGLVTAGVGVGGGWAIGAFALGGAAAWRRIGATWVLLIWALLLWAATRLGGWG